MTREHRLRFKEHRETPAVTAAHIYTGFRTLKWSVNIPDFSQPLRDLKFAKLMTAPEKGALRYQSPRHRRGGDAAFGRRLMLLIDFVQQVEGFDALSPKDKIKVFGWYLHVHKRLPSFDNESIRTCFKQLHLTAPDVSVYLPRMAATKPPELLKERGRYLLPRNVRVDLDKKHGVHQTVVQVSKLLSDLPDRVPDLVERAFLREALACYRAEAFRACIVMSWNLAFDHLLRWILTDGTRLLDFNAAITRRFPKKTGISISSIEHFEELKEAEVVDICQTASLI